MSDLDSDRLRSYHGLIDDFIKSRGNDRVLIKDQINREYSVDTVILVLDMCGFSLTTQTKGIVFYLSMVRRMQNLCREFLPKYDGSVVKFEADNLFARFANVDDAIQFALAVRTGFDAQNTMTFDGADIHVCIGIAAGEVLMIERNDVWGEAVNTACALGEDCAEADEILVDADAFAKVDNPDRYSSTRHDVKKGSLTLHSIKID
ncbi:MAG: adenylate/guanylate cyclase domain-containing protein [Pikeienuella sp.]